MLQNFSERKMKSFTIETNAGVESSWWKVTGAGIEDVKKKKMNWQPVPESERVQATRRNDL